MPSVDAGVVRRNRSVDGDMRRDAVFRIVRSNEDHLLSLVQPTAVARLILTRRGVLTHLPCHVLLADRRASVVLSERLTSVERFRCSNDVTALPIDELRRYNEKVVRTIKLFHVYRKFQLWQESMLPNHAA
uniref:Cyclic nucleotide-binding domain-containing protein n=1 Tax=Caenorhabditis tropicalis TaxID=1561998 RepID=A0A1I7T5Q4_9PELO